MKKHDIDQLCRVFLKIGKSQEVLLVLKDLLTPDELNSVAERLQIFKLLVRGVPHRTISQKLKVSIAKVTRGSHALRRSKGHISRVLKSL